jgi:hypothetical protein
MLSCGGLLPVLAAFAVYCAGEKLEVAPVVAATTSPSSSVAAITEPAIATAHVPQVVAVAPAAPVVQPIEIADTNIAESVPDEPVQILVAKKASKQRLVAYEVGASKGKRKKARRYIVTRDKRRIDCVVHPFQCRRYENANGIQAQEPEQANASTVLKPGTQTQPTSSMPQADPVKVMTFTMDTTFSE